MAQCKLLSFRCTAAFRCKAAVRHVVQLVVPPGLVERLGHQSGVVDEEREDTRGVAGAKLVRGLALKRLLHVPANGRQLVGGVSDACASKWEAVRKGHTWCMCQQMGGS